MKMEKQIHSDNHFRLAAEATARPSIAKTMVAGLIGGVIFSIVGFLTFVLIGSGLDHSSGPLFDPALQSPKVIAVWMEIEPLPLFQTSPQWMLLGYVLFGIGHAFLFRSVANAWPRALRSRIWRLALVIWGLSCLFFEFLGPFNLLGEPVGLVALELGFWAAMALAESAVIVLLLSRGTSRAAERVPNFSQATGDVHIL